MNRLMKVDFPVRTGPDNADVNIPAGTGGNVCVNRRSVHSVVLSSSVLQNCMSPWTRICRRDSAGGIDYGQYVCAVCACTRLTEKASVGNCACSFSHRIGMITSSVQKWSASIRLMPSSLRRKKTVVLHVRCHERVAALLRRKLQHAAAGAAADRKLLHRASSVDIAQAVDVQPINDIWQKIRQRHGFRQPADAAASQRAAVSGCTRMARGRP